MIYESYPYFENLKNYTRRYHSINLNSFNEDQVEEFLCELERDTFYAAFVVRKLIESRKVADSFEDQQIVLKRYNSLNRHNSLVEYRFDELYDFSNCRAQAENRKIGFICNQLVHSNVFDFCFNDEARNVNSNIENQVTGFFINSDQTVQKYLYYVSWENWISFIQSVQNYKVDTIHRFKQKNGTIVEYKFNSIMDSENQNYRKTLKDL